MRVHNKLPVNMIFQFYMYKILQCKQFQKYVKMFIEQDEIGVVNMSQAVGWPSLTRDIKIFGV